MDPSSPTSTQMEQGYNTRLPPSTSSLSSPERSEGSGLPGLGARQAAQNLSSCQRQQQQQQQQAMQQGQCPQAAAPSLVESQLLSCAPGLAQWPSMTAVPPSVTGQQGRPQLRLQKNISFRCKKTNPKTSLLYLLVLIMTTFPFLLC